MKKQQAAADLNLAHEILTQALPISIAKKLTQHWDEFVAGSTEEQQRQIAKHLESLRRFWLGSEFSAEICARQPKILCELLESGDLDRDYPKDFYQQKIEAECASIETLESLEKYLRKTRRRELLRLIWRDLNDQVDLKTLLAEWTEFSDACIRVAEEKLFSWLCKEWGTPLHKNGQPQRLIVIALGKLGGEELNLSSDIDLMLTYPEDGEIHHENEPITHQAFFARLSQRLIRLLHTVTGDGFVFRVDMRLRPFGSSGLLVLNQKAMQEYYQEHGRDWERYALVKARMITGDEKEKQKTLKIIRDFVYQSYADYSALNALEEMKNLLRREADSKGLQDDIKRGPGGIRELEFQVQVLQLIYGGQEKSLQTQSFLLALDRLEESKKLNQELAKDFRGAYVFLRRLEHRLQYLFDQQTQKIFSNEDERLRVILSLGYEKPEDFFVDLEKQRHGVHQYFLSLFSSPDKPGKLIGKLLAEQVRLQQFWQSSLPEKPTKEFLFYLGYRDEDRIWTQLKQLRESERYTALKRRDKRCVDNLLPLLLTHGLSLQAPVSGMTRVLSILSVLLSRIKRIRFLLDHPGAIQQLVALAGESAWVADQLSTQTLLLEDLSNARTLYEPLDRDTLRAELRQRLVGIPLENLEEQMDCLRRFKNTHVLRVAAAEMKGVLPLMKVSDHLTFTAEAILSEVQSIARQDLVLKHGRPTDEKGEAVKHQFSIIGYGKLGGIEMGYGSDLDLVFVHVDLPTDAMTDGADSISNTLFYTRLAQRIIYILTALTGEGRLYQVDTRLRPSGEAGLLVCSMNAFVMYQREAAWTWEHQALVRAQPMTGSQALCEQFYEVRSEVLRRSRDANVLKTSVSNMRQKMREAASLPEKGFFDVKQGQGGITDIEFLVQYLVLRWSDRHPSLVRYSDNIRQLESLAAANLLSADDAALLCRAYQSYRSVVHRHDLQNAPAWVPETEFIEEREGVQHLWAVFLDT